MWQPRDHPDDTSHMPATDAATARRKNNSRAPTMYAKPSAFSTTLSRSQPGRCRRLDLILQEVQQLLIASEHETCDREGDHQQRHQRQHAEECDRRRVMITAVGGVACAARTRWSNHG